MGDRTSDIGDWARLDIDRAARAGVPEAVFASSKTLEQVVAIAERLTRENGRALITRLRPGWGDPLRDRLGAGGLSVALYADGRLAVSWRADSERVEPSGGVIALLAAGTADLPVAIEAEITAREMGCEVLRHVDVGVAGLHRLKRPIDEARQREVAAVIVVAGMEGALPSVVKGLVSVPVIGVPTSVGYGYGGDGTAALMAMLQSCSPGLTVVNIDNGFGAGATAALIANQLAAARARSAIGPSGGRGDPTG